MSFHTTINKLKEFLDELDRYYRNQAVRQTARDRDALDDFFMLVCFGEIYGVDNPYTFQTLELMELLAPDYHDWHRRMGVSGVFFENFPCPMCC